MPVRWTYDLAREFNFVVSKLTGLTFANTMTNSLITSSDDLK